MKCARLFRASQVLDLSSFSMMAGEIGDGFTVSPDGSIILPYRIHPFEIYSLDYSEQ